VTRAVLLLALVAADSGCGACEPDPTLAPQDGPTSSVVPLATGSTPLAAPARRRPVLTCRATAADGDVRTDADASVLVPTRTELPTDGYLTLGVNTRLVAKDPRTTRETTFRGPGRVRVCVDSLEESWLASGSFESSAGAGEIPGAEEWVVTPLGVTRFDAARLTVQVLPRRYARAPGSPAVPPEPARPTTALDEVRIRVSEGVAFMWIADDASVGGPAGAATEEGWSRLTQGVVTLIPTATRPALKAARAAVDACAVLGRSTRDLASALLAADGSADGAMAARHVTTRRLARAACAVAALRVDILPATDRAGMLAMVTDAASLWRALPIFH
jgi:hypothetical protein